MCNSGGSEKSSNSHAELTVFADRLNTGNKIKSSQKWFQGFKFWKWIKTVAFYWDRLLTFPLSLSKVPMFEWWVV